MAGTILPQAVETFVDANGKPLAGGSVYMYIPGTTTFKNTYQDPAQTILNTNPIILNASGQAIIWGTGSYRQQVFDQFNNLIWDQVTEDTTSGLLGNMTDQRFVANTDYTPGTTTSLTLSTAPVTLANTWLYFDGVYQTDDTIASLNGFTLTFNNPIPVGVQEVNVKMGTTIAIGTPASGSVTDSSINTSSVLYRHVYSWVTSKDYGAVGNGTTNDSVNLLAADSAAFAANKPLVFIAGNYLIGTNTTFTSNVYFSPGAMLTVSTGITLAFNGVLDAPSDQQIFNTSATNALVTVNPLTTATGYPEWWGAQPNNSSFDSSVAINACIVACRITQLQAGDYYLASGSPIKMQIPHRKLVGKGFYEEEIAGTVTGVWMMDGSTDVVLMGPASQPGTINDYIKELDLENMFISRTIAPVISSGCVGVADQWTLYSRKKNVKSAEHMTGFYINNVVQSHNHQLWAFRSTAGTGGGSDLFNGYFLDGRNIIGSGGNASLYMTECLAGTGGPAPVATSNGYFLLGSFADTFIDHAEVSSCGIGMQLNMTASTTLNFEAVDLQITNPVLDSCTIACLYFNTTTEFGAISVLGGYGALSAASGNTAAVYFNASAASVKLMGFQCVMGTVSGIPGILATNSSNIDSSCIITECSSSAIDLSTVTNSKFDDVIVNNVTGGSSGGAILGVAVSRCKFNNSVKGGAGLWSIGYNMTGSNNNYSEWNCTGINSTTVTTKLILNGITITTQGIPSSNMTDYVSGVMA
jgi:hypothetical protein